MNKYKVEYANKDTRKLTQIIASETAYGLPEIIFGAIKTATILGDPRPNILVTINEQNETTIWSIIDDMSKDEVIAVIDGYIEPELKAAIKQTAPPQDQLWVQFFKWNDAGNLAEGTSIGPCTRVWNSPSAGITVTDETHETTIILGEHGKYHFCNTQSQSEKYDEYRVTSHRPIIGRIYTVQKARKVMCGHE